MVPGHKNSARGDPVKNRDEEPLPNSAAGQARQFYYGTDQQEMTVNSGDFDHVYEMTGQSQALKALAASKNDVSMAKSSVASNRQSKSGNAFSFGGQKDDKNDQIVGPDHQLIEDSTNSALCNMAISMDPM